MSKEGDAEQKRLAEQRADEKAQDLAVEREIAAEKRRHQEDEGSKKGR